MAKKRGGSPLGNSPLGNTPGSTPGSAQAQLKHSNQRPISG
ncbi:hypothetical protein AB6D20_027625 (plasmid) [Vibrio splendidus]